MKKRYIAYRDGLDAFTCGEVIETEKAIVEILYKDKTTDKKLYFAEIKGTTLCAHGYTVEDAIEEAYFKDKNYKISEEEKQKYREPDFRFTVGQFRRLTGACKAGINEWLESRNLDWSIKMSVAEFEKAGGGQWVEELRTAIEK